MIDRKELAEELMLRENVRRAIRLVSAKKVQRNLVEQKDETRLRGIIRSLLREGQSAVAGAAKHDSTGINALEDLLKNTNVLSVLETGYKSLTTDPQQRESYKNHILSAIQKSLAPEESRKAAGEDVEITEEIDISMGRPEDDPDFINVEEEPEEELDPKEEFGLNGEDKTGRNRAFTDFQSIEKVILTAFDDLDNSRDITLFEEYLLKNISLYFEKYESELEATVKAPDASLGAVANATAGSMDAAEEDTAIPEFALEELINHLNVDDIIKNLL